MSTTNKAKRSTKASREPSSTQQQPQKTHSGKREENPEMQAKRNRAKLAKISLVQMKAAVVELATSAGYFSKCPHEQNVFTKYLMDIFWAGVNYGHQSTQTAIKGVNCIEVEPATVVKSAYLEMAAMLRNMHDEPIDKGVN